MFLFISVHLKYHISFIIDWYLVNYIDILSKRIWFDNVFYVYFFECFSTRRVVQIDSKSCLEACLQAGFDNNFYKKHSF